MSQSGSEFKDDPILKAWAEKHRTQLSKTYDNVSGSEFFSGDPTTGDPYLLFAEAFIPTKYNLLDDSVVNHNKIYADLCTANIGRRFMASYANSDYKDVAEKAQKDFLNLLLQQIKLGTVTLDEKNFNEKEEKFREEQKQKGKQLTSPLQIWLKEIDTVNLSDKKGEVVAKFNILKQELYDDYYSNLPKLTFLILTANDFLPEKPKGLFAKDPYLEQRKIFASLRDSLLLHCPDIVMLHQEAIKSIYLGTDKPKLPLDNAMKIIETFQEQRLLTSPKK